MGSLAWGNRGLSPEMGERRWSGETGADPLGAVPRAVRKEFGRDARKRLSRMGPLPKSAGVSGSRSG